MFSITVALKDNPVVWTLLYRTQDSFTIAQGLLAAAYEPSDRVHLADDFGQTALIRTRDVAGILAEDLDQSKLAYVERTLHVERMKIAANRAAQADPAIKTSLMTRGNGGSPAMFDPTR